jgi:hypothetical protein
VTRLRDRNDLATSSSSVLGSFDNSGQVDNL